jgi:pilus assembly protein CpaF
MFGKKSEDSADQARPKKKAASKENADPADVLNTQADEIAPEPAAHQTDAAPKPKKKKKAPQTQDDASQEGSVAAESVDITPPAAAAATAPATDDEQQKKKSKDFNDDTLVVEEDGIAGEDSVDGQSASMSSLRIKRAHNRIWSDLRDGIDLKALARMDSKAARDEIFTAVEEIARFRNLDLTQSELKQIARECADDMLGFGPLEPLLEMEGIADIMINGPDTTFIELNGKIQKADIAFRDNAHLVTICQRIVGAIGRRVDESSPICDARLPDGSRVNVIIPPLAVDGACMTIRKFAKEKLTLEKLMGFGSLTPSCAKLIMAIGRCRVNVLVSGGTGSGKTTMLNCLTRYIEQGERIITCEDACELQLQQEHVVRLETRPPNLEGVGEVTMRDLVKNCLRMRPERIIVGEVRGPEAFDLLQAMNTGHDGSMGTVHANNPREAISRMENMIAMGGFNIPIVAIREQIASAVSVIIQVQRLRDGSRKVTHVSELTGMEGEVVTLQDLFVLDYQGETEDGNLITTQKSTGLRPKFYDKARQFGVEQLVLDAMEEAYG